MKNFIKKSLAASLMLAGVSAQAAEAPMPRQEKRKLAEIETVAVEQTDESKKAKTKELSAFENLPGDVKRIIGGFLVTATGNSPSEQLENSAKNIRNFMNLNKSFRTLINNETVTGYIIIELAKRYTDNDLALAGAALRTDVAGKWLQKQNVNANNALLTAIIDENNNAIPFILKYFPAAVNATYENQDTPLMFAIYTKQIDIIKLLLRVPGINLEMRNVEGKTAIQEVRDNLGLSSTRKEQATVIALLIEHGAEYNITN